MTILIELNFDSMVEKVRHLRQEAIASELTGVQEDDDVLQWVPEPGPEDSKVEVQSIREMLYGAYMAVAGMLIRKALPPEREGDFEKVLDIVMQRTFQESGAIERNAVITNTIKADARQISAWVEEAIHAVKVDDLVA